jgi:hypothetical protein
MKLRSIHIILTTVGLFSLFFVAIPYWVHNENGNKSISLEELTKLEGHLKSIRETTTGGKHSKPIVYLELNEYPHTFRIANSSYRAINPHAFGELATGTSVDIWTKGTELARSTSNGIVDKILNSMLKWRKQPLIYAMATNDNPLLTIQQYNEQEEEFNFDNIVWGIVLVAFIAGRLIWVSCMEEKEKHATTLDKKT